MCIYMRIEFISYALGFCIQNDFQERTVCFSPLEEITTEHRIAFRSPGCEDDSNVYFNANTASLRAHIGMYLHHRCQLLCKSKMCLHSIKQPPPPARGTCWEFSLQSLRGLNSSKEEEKTLTLSEWLNVLCVERGEKETHCCTDQSHY